MKVWELMAKLEKCQANAKVWIATGGTLFVPAESFSYENEGEDVPNVNISSAQKAEPEDE